MTSSEFSVEGTASVKDEMGDDAIVAAIEAHKSAWAKPGNWDREAMEAAIRAYLAAAPSRDQVTMGALTVTDAMVELIRMAKVYANMDTPDYPWSQLNEAKKYLAKLADALESTLTPPIAGAGEEPVGWRWRLNGFDPWQFTDGPEWQGLGLPTSFEAKASKEPVYSAASISQLYSRIGELERERDDYKAAWDKFSEPAVKSFQFENGEFNMALTGPAMEHIAACVVGHFKAMGATNYFEMSLFDRDEPFERYVVTVQKVSAKSPHELRKAAEVKLAEARDVIEPFAAAIEPDATTISGWRFGIPAKTEDFVRARSFHSPKEPAGGGK